MPKKRSLKSFKRRKYYRELNQYFLITCEGEKTEPNYFNSFRVKKEIIKLDVCGLGCNTDSLIDETVRIKNEREKKLGIKFDQVWCVFDRDSFPAQNFNLAIEKARHNKFEVAYSNEAFELWYVLHFQFIDTGITRDQYCEILDKLLGHKYLKNSPNIYEQLKAKQYIAFQNATKLLTRYNPCNPEKDKPSTTVHLLVEELNKYTL